MNKIIIPLLCVFLIFCSIAICRTKTTATTINADNNQKSNRCEKDKGYTEIKDGACYNPKTGISYYKNKKSNNIVYYKNGQQCGGNCDYNGRNCSWGVCNIEDCARDKGYTEIKTIGGTGNCYNPKTSDSYEINTKDCARDKGYTRLMKGNCYNPETGLSYYTETNNEFRRFYKNGQQCGYKCDYNGRNCSKGICSTEDCAKGKGYNELKIIGGMGHCYNRNKDLSYDTNKAYYKNGQQCGYNCDYNGRNCSKGICSTEDCAKDKGYNELKIIGDEVHCYNRNKGLSYNKNKHYYKNGQKCGENCDYNGRNCSWGVCNIEDCAKDKGYTEIKDGWCYNPNTGFAYMEQTKFSGKTAKKNKYIFIYYSNNQKAQRYFDCNDISLNDCSTDMNLILKHGYTDVIKAKIPGSFGIDTSYVLYNRQTNLAIYRDSYGDSLYLYKGAICGKNCNPDGRNCKEGICNIADCRLKGMSKFEFIEEKHDVHSMCTKMMPGCTYKMTHAVCGK